MAVAIAVEVNKTFEVRADIAAVFALLADVPRSISHFPKLRKLVDLGAGSYRWEMEPMGTAGISHQVVYACRYSADAQKHAVTWAPVAGVGNGVIQGSWALRQAKSGTQVRFQTGGTLEVPVPRLLKSVAEPFVTGEFERSISTYIENLCKTLESET